MSKGLACNVTSPHDLPADNSSTKFYLSLQHCGRNLEKAITIFLTDMRFQFPKVTFEFKLTKTCHTGMDICIIAHQDAENLQPWEDYVNAIQMTFTHHGIRLNSIPTTQSQNASFCLGASSRIRNK